MFKRVLKWLTGPRLKPSDLSFADARAILERASDEAKVEVAKGAKTPEILEYLSQDAQAAVRALVAGNRHAPPAVDLALSEDVSGDVRAELARKIARLVPGLSAGETVALRETSIKVLERLAADALPRVRAIVAEEIKAARHVPKAIAQRLARDAEIAVAAPILEYSPLLADQDLVEIIATSEVEGVLEAIAKRRNLSAEVSDAVVATLDIPAVAALLANQTAEIRAVTLEYVVENAAGIETWHAPLVLRPELSLRAVRRIAGFAASALLETLARRHNLDEETRVFISSRVRERLKSDLLAPASDEKAHQRAVAAVEHAHKSGRLDDEFIAEAIANEDRLRVTVGLAAMGAVPEVLVERILKSSNGQIITAFAWHAGLAMRTAFLVQKDLAHLGTRDLVPARNGVDYPLTDDQMCTQLQMLGVVPRR
jgi:uncharacterized protein (DUF2336 family)